MNRSANARIEDLLGEFEPDYKSRGEAQVGRLLDRYGIPFLYEQPTLIYDRGRHHVWHPDFTLPTYNGMVIEYAGMPDRPDYLEGIRHKTEAYARNEIPALFVFPEDLTGPKWPQVMYQKVMQTYREDRWQSRMRRDQRGGPSGSLLSKL